MFAIALVSSVYGPLGDVLGRKRVMTIGCALLAAATLACGFAPGYAALVVLRAAQGLLVPSVSAVAVAYLGDLRPGKDPGSLVFAAITLLAAAALLFALEESKVPATYSGFGAAYREMGAHMGNPRLFGAFVVAATLFFGFIGLFTYLPYLLSTPPFSLSTGTIAWFYAAYLAGVFTAPLVGRLSSRYPRRILMAAGFVVG